MKKFFEKYDLLKVSGVLVLIAVLMSWVFPHSQFTGAEVVTEEITRIGLTSFFQYFVDGLRFFTVYGTFLFVMGGFYQLLSKRAGYQKLVKTISEKLKGFEIPVVLLVSLIFSCLSSLATEIYPLLVFVPFVIAILSKMKVDKICAFAATFGGMLVGTIGSTFGSSITGALIQTFKVEVADVLTTNTIVFVLAFILLNLFTVLRLLKTKKKDKKVEEYDKFTFDKPLEGKKASKTWPYAVMMILIFVTVALAYMPWATWEVTVFTDATAWVNEFTLAKIPLIGLIEHIPYVGSIANVPFLSYIFGAFTEFGGWNIYMTMYIMLAATLLIQIFGHMHLDDVFQSYGEGFKKMGYPVLVMLMAYLVLEFAFDFMVLPGVVEAITNWSDGFNTFNTFLGAFITSIFSVELPYAMTLTGSYYAATFTEALPAMTVIYQMAFGLVSFFIPSSALLMIGLSYIGISYKNWMKFIWKFLLAMVLVIAVILIVLA